MTLQQKADELIRLAGAMKYDNQRGELDLVTVQHLAGKAKALAQSIRAQARTTEMRVCEHEPGESHTYLEVRGGDRRRVKYTRCAKCRKTYTSVDVTDQEVRTL